MLIVLLHPQYDDEHLQQVIAEMQIKGAPVIRCIWSKNYSCYFAVEGCHRLRAAAALNINPIIKDISAQKTATIQLEQKNKKVFVKNFLAEMEEDASTAAYLDFNIEIEGSD